jgi:transcription initiation factor TFIIIB Brf1 subunit/transcription initiation factor TFIIB
MDSFKRVQLKEVLALSHFLWADKLVADKIAFEAAEIINQAYTRKSAFFNGRRSTWIAGGLLYLLSYRFNSIKNQKELADKLGTTDNTIRDAYRQWLKTFPDLFLDVIGKFANDDKLCYFILIDLKKDIALKATV